MEKIMFGKMKIFVMITAFFVMLLMMFFSGCYSCEGCGVAEHFFVKNNSDKVLKIVVLKETGIVTEEFFLESQGTKLILESEPGDTYLHLKGGGEFYELYLDDEFTYGCDDNPTSLVYGTFPNGKEIKTEKKKKDFHVITVSMFIWCGNELCEKQCSNQYDKSRKYDDQSDVCPGDNKFCHSYGELNWSQAFSVNNWHEAEKYCNNMEGRLPTINELRATIRNCPYTEYPKPSGQEEWCEVEDPHKLALIDSSPACYKCDISTNIFGDKDFFWSSSKQSGSEEQAWGVNFKEGSVVNSFISFSEGKIRCVDIDD